MKKFLSILSLLILTSVFTVSHAFAGFTVTVKPVQDAQTYKRGDVVDFNVFVNVDEADELNSFQFSIAFDSLELEWANPEAEDKGVAIQLHTPANWAVFSLGDPVFAMEYSADVAGKIQTISMLNASKNIFPPSLNGWSIEGETLIASFSLKLKSFYWKDGLKDVWAFNGSDLGEGFSFKNQGVVVIRTDSTGIGEPDFGRNHRYLEYMKQRASFMNNRKMVVASKSFKQEAMSTLPLLSVDVADPANAEIKNGPQPGEVWIRIRPEKSALTQTIMAQTGQLYKDIYGQQQVDVLLWVGGRLLTKKTY